MTIFLFFNLYIFKSVGVYFFGASMLCLQAICLGYRLFAVCPNRTYVQRFSSTQCTVLLGILVLVVGCALSYGLYNIIAPSEVCCVRILMETKILWLLSLCFTLKHIV